MKNNQDYKAFPTQQTLEANSLGSDSSMKDYSIRSKRGDNSVPLGQNNLTLKTPKVKGIIGKD